MSVFAVAIKDPFAPPLAAAGFLSGIKGFNRDSAREHLRRQPGFLGRGMALVAAEELRAAAAAAGFETMLLQEEALRPPPPPVRPVRIEFKGNGFNYVASSVIEFMPYGEITILCAGAFDAPLPPPNTKALEDSLFLKIRGALFGPDPLSAVPRAVRETFFRADILAGRQRVRLLLEPENMDFSSLGAERSQSSLVNFRTLLGKLSAPAFSAVKNAFLRAFLAGEQLAEFKLASAGACDTELARLLLYK